MTEGAARIECTFLFGSGEMSALINDHDWSSTSLGPPEAWPQSLRTAAGIVLGSSQPMLLVWGPALVCLYNDAFRSILGARHPTALGQPVREIWPDLWPIMRSHLDLAFAGRGSQSEHLPLVTRKAGAPQINYYNLSYNPVPGENMGPAGVLCACTETTRIVADHPAGPEGAETAQANSEGRRTDEALLLALRAGRSIAFEIDLRTGQAIRSTTSEEILGLPSGPHQEFLNGIDPEDRAVLARVCQEAQASGRSEGAEIRFRKADGEVVWLSVRMEARVDATGAPIALYGLGTDITARKLAEEKIAFQASLLNAVEQAVIATDLEGTVTFYNRFAEKLYGWTAEEALGQYVVDLTWGGDQDEVAATMAVLANAGGWSGEFPAKHKDGSVFPAYVADSPIYDGLGRQIGIIGVSHDIRKQKEVEASLREKSAFLEATLENMDQGIIVMDAEGRVALFNERVLELLDLPRELLEKRPTIGEIEAHQERRGDYLPQDYAEIQVRESQNFLSDTPVCGQVRPNGKVIEFRTVHLPDGRDVRTYTDITARRHAEAELRASAERLRLVGRATNDAIWDWDLRTDGIIWNEAVQMLFGYSMEDVSPSSQWWKDRIHPEDWPRVVESIERFIVTGGALWSGEYRFRRADGSYAHVLDRGYLIRSPDGQAVRMVGAIQDQSERRAAQTALEESERRYRLLAENMGDMIVLSGSDRVRLYVSPTSRDLLGYEPEELVGTTPDAIIHPDDQDISRAEFETLIQGPTPKAVTSVHRLLHKEGHWVMIESRQRSLFDQAGNPQGTITVVRDITERQKLETQLRQAQKMEALGSLTGGICHDYNNLLTVMLGNAEVLGETLSDPAALSLAKMIEDAAAKGAELTQRLLAFARRQTLQPERLRLDEVIGSMTGLLRRSLGEHVAIQTNFSPESTPALADRAMLESAILNLAVNARDAMPQGGTLIIETGETAAGPNQGAIPIGQPMVFVRVTDTGTGMPPEVLERVFEPFFTTKPVGKGSGLGLSMVYGFAQQSGGHVEIRAREGEGTSVTILLRAMPDAAIAQNKASPEQRLARGSGRVLLVEDAPDVRVFISAQLRSLGYEVVEAEDGVEGLRLLQEQDGFDLLMTDVVLPKGISGIQLAHGARAARPDLKVLLTSGYSEDAFEAHGRPSEDMLLLRKPFRRKELADTLKAILERP